MIGLVDFQRQWEKSGDTCLRTLERVGKRGWWILGPEVEQFETSLARSCGQKHAIGCASGLDALEIALRAAGLRPGDGVLTTPLSAFATTLAIVRAGGVPVFADVDDSGLLDLAHAEKVLGQLAAPARFIVPVHLYGHAMNLNELRRFATAHRLTVIEDCAQAVGAKFEGQPVGTASRACATSFYPTKNLGAFGDGGALLTDDAEIDRLARRLRDYGQSEKYVHAELGLNSRLDELQAALLHSVQLPKLGAETQRRQAVARRYLDEIRHPALRPVVGPPGSESVWHLFPVLVRGDREAFRAHLHERGVGSAIHYPKLIPHQPAMQSIPAGGEMKQLPKAEAFASGEVSLPMHGLLTDDEATKVIEACNQWGGS